MFSISLSATDWSERRHSALIEYCWSALCLVSDHLTHLTDEVTRNVYIWNVSHCASHVTPSLHPSIPPFLGILNAHTLTPTIVALIALHTTSDIRYWWEKENIIRTYRKRSEIPRLMVRWENVYLRTKLMSASTGEISEPNIHQFPKGHTEQIPGFILILSEII